MVDKVLKQWRGAVGLHKIRDGVAVMRHEEAVCSRCLLVWRRRFRKIIDERYERRVSEMESRAEKLWRTGIIARMIGAWKRATKDLRRADHMRVYNVKRRILIVWREKRAAIVWDAEVKRKSFLEWKRKANAIREMHIRADAFWIRSVALDTLGRWRGTVAGRKIEHITLILQWESRVLRKRWTNWRVRMAVQAVRDAGADAHLRRQTKKKTIRLWRRRVEAVRTDRDVADVFSGRSEVERWAGRWRRVRDGGDGAAALSRSLRSSAGVGTANSLLKLAYKIWRKSFSRHQELENTGRARDKLTILSGVFNTWRKSAKVRQKERLRKAIEVKQRLLYDLEGAAISRSVQRALSSRLTQWRHFLHEREAARRKQELEVKQKTLLGSEATFAMQKMLRVISSKFKAWRRSLYLKDVQRLKKTTVELKLATLIELAKNAEARNAIKMLTSRFTIWRQKTTAKQEDRRRRATLVKQHTLSEREHNFSQSVATRTIVTAFNRWRASMQMTNAENRRIENSQRIKDAWKRWRAVWSSHIFRIVRMEVWVYVVSLIENLTNITDRYFRRASGQESQRRGP
ncbi:hypothetical protein BJ742DRAFT_243010 [Cladochytrium replicatum]|nr:hypothetical protein BJ742DRAFT_243010 [Cladochytrium replicatum]